MESEKEHQKQQRQCWGVSSPSLPVCMHKQPFSSYHTAALQQQQWQVLILAASTGQPGCCKRCEKGSSQRPSGFYKPFVGILNCSSKGRCTAQHINLDKVARSWQKQELGLCFGPSPESHLTFPCPLCPPTSAPEGQETAAQFHQGWGVCCTIAAAFPSRTAAPHPLQGKRQ